MNGLRESLRLRALHWYHRALPSLGEGADKLKVETRISQVANEYGTDVAKPPRRKSPPA